MIGRSQHRLQHSKSMDNELDVSYLDMNSVAGKNGRKNSAEYLIMSPNGKNSMGSSPKLHNSHADPAIYINRSALKPFDNLLQHKAYTENKLQDSDDTVSLGSSIRITDGNSTGDRSSSEDDNSSQKSGKSGKKSTSPLKSSRSTGLFSRLMKRNSVKSKEKLEKEKVKLKQSCSTQDFSLSSKNKPDDRRHSIQPTCNSGNIQATVESSSRLGDMSELVDQHSPSPSTHSMSSSHRSDSPAESGLVTLSQWKLGGGVANIPPSQRPLTSKDTAHIPSTQLSPLHKAEYGSCPLNITECTSPPVLPPKTYKKLSKEQLTSSVTLPVRRHSSEDCASVSSPYVEASVENQKATYTNSTTITSTTSMQGDVSSYGLNVVPSDCILVHDDDDDGPPDELPPPPPIPEKTKGSKKSLLGFAELSTMETVHEGSNSAEKDIEIGSHAGSEVDDDDVFP